MDKILLVGASDYCRYTIDIVEQEKKYEIVGILDWTFKAGDFHGGYEILGYIDQLEVIMETTGAIGGIVAIGDNYTRRIVVQKIQLVVPDFQFVNAIHPSVIIGKDVNIGFGSVLMAGVVVNNDCLIGNHCYFGTKSSLEHDSIIGNFSSLGPGVTTGGRTNIGNGTAIGIGATILHNKKIGDSCVVGASSLVTKDIGNDVLAFGIPAKNIRKRKSNEKYL